MPLTTESDFCLRSIPEEMLNNFSLNYLLAWQKITVIHLHHAAISQRFDDH